MKKMNKKLSFFVIASVLILLFGCFNYMVDREAEKDSFAASSKKITMVKGDSIKLTVSTKETVTWKSSKKSVATISKSGKVKAKKKGSTTITATYKKNGKNKKITYKIKVVNPTLNVKSKLTLEKGKTKQLKIKYAKNTVKWKSSKSSVVKVSSKGKITAKKAGKATITATYHGKKYKTVVTVKDSSGSGNSGGSDDSDDDSDDDDSGDDDGGDSGGTEEDEKAIMEASAEWKELWLQVDVSMLATYAGIVTEMYTEDSFKAYKELGSWYAGRRYQYQNYTQLMADINTYGYPDDKLVKFTDEEIKRKKDLEELYSSREWQWTVINAENVLKTEYDPLNHVKESYDEVMEIARYYLSKKDVYENLSQLLADIEIYGYPSTDNIERIPYTVEVVSYPDIAKQVLDEINAYRKSLNAAAGYEKYEPYVWSDENALIAKTQAVYNMKSCRYRSTSKDGANHGVGSIGTATAFVYPRTDEERVDMASAAPNWSVQNWDGSPSHQGYLRKILTPAMVEDLGYQNNIGIAVVSSTWSSGLGQITVIAYLSRCETPNVITEKGTSPDDPNLMYTDPTVPISLGTSFYGSEVTALLSDVRELKGTTYVPLLHSPFKEYYGTDVDSESVGRNAACEEVIEETISVSENDIQ